MLPNGIQFIKNKSLKWVSTLVAVNDTHTLKTMHGVHGFQTLGAHPYQIGIKYTAPPPPPPPPPPPTHTHNKAHTLQLCGGTYYGKELWLIRGAFNAPYHSHIHRCNVSIYSIFPYILCLLY